MNAVSLIAQVECRKRGSEFFERILKERLSPMFETKLTELATLANIPGKNYRLAAAGRALVIAI